ncbi:ABC transporter permease [Chitinophaga ginsengisoli]|uniref:Putative ABC transport system permease protein n=1 Tax=Chitinophaga ginsengisoli TaxID=363837 RepID=A0A2P8FC34_9BACT|nr:ABC transporter permease [Chitinophaga ginsengisoli]PSL19280.1 putative ABC transport system permease protein [Chitinophaga ginsengisoli]
MIKNYLKTAIRNLLRNKVYSVINVLGLSIGLACGMLIILYVKDEVSYDRFHENLSSIYRIGIKTFDKDGKMDGKGGYTGYLQGPRFAANIPGIKTFVRVQSDMQDVKTGTAIKAESVHRVDSAFFSVFSFPLLSGNPATALTSPDGIVISEDMAKRQFSTTDALGKTIMMKSGDEAFKPYTVTGVAKRSPQNSSLKFNVLMPIKPSAAEEANDDNWFNFFLNTFILLQPGTDAAKVEQKIRQFYAKDAAEALKRQTEKYGPLGTVEYHLQSLPDLHLSRDYRADNGLTNASDPLYSYILSGIALFVLLIACINFVNLTIARLLKRAKEIGIRKVVGGDRRQLMMQFMGESFILSFAAFLLALIMVKLSLPVFNELANKALALQYLFDGRLVMGYILLFLATSLLAGFYPSLILSGYNPVNVLYNRFTLSGKNYLQKGLIVLQFTLASFLIIGTITIYSQFSYLTNEKLGYDDTHLVTVRHSRIPYEQTEHIRAELMKSPAVADVSFRSSGDWTTSAKVSGETSMDFVYETVDESYLPMLKVPIIKGRNFSKAFPSDSTHSVMVNEAFVKEAGWKNAIGQEVNFWYNQEKYTVIGVVKDYHYAGMAQKIGPQLFTMKHANQYGSTFIKLHSNSETAALTHIEKIFKQVFPLSPYEYTFKDVENRQRYEAEARWKQIILLSALLTIFVSCIGLFGLSVLSAERRTKEIGIRKVLGASVASVVTILSKDFLKLVIISLVLAMPVAWYAGNKWLENYPYRITLNWWLFATAAFLVSAIALATVSFHAVKAAVADPVKSLRAE